jgi:ElaB/YqjD/DUF883 family membrane-anchored ribosome-binding protein
VKRWPFGRRSKESGETEELELPVSDVPSESERPSGTDEEPAVSVPAQELGQVTVAIARIKTQLDATVSLVEKISARPEGEVEELFVRAQRFIDGVLADTRRQAVAMEELFVRAQQFIDRETDDARARASQLLINADARADEIVAQAQEQARQLTSRTANYLANYLAFPPDVLEHLDESIESFTRANDELAKELEALK